MGLTGRRPTPDEFDTWRARSVEAYAQDELAAGRVSAADALAQSAASYDELLPDGPDTPGTRLLRLEADGRPVGWLWVSARGNRTAPGTAWVFDVEVDEDARGQGHGRAAMLLAEDVARSLGATALGLNVFGSNTVARSLYASLGYEPTALQLRKPL